MSKVGQKEVLTQKRLVKLFRDSLKYDYLGDWRDRAGNDNVEPELLRKWLERQGHSAKVIDKVLYQLDQARALGGSKNLYDANREVYSLLRYGIKIPPEVGEQKITVKLIDWEKPENNDFATAEYRDTNNSGPPIVFPAAFQMAFLIPGEYCCEYVSEVHPDPQ